MSVPLAASLPEWLTAIGGIGAFVATAVLAFLAFKQMKAARDQVDVMRESASDQAKTVREQIEASVAQGNAIRQAARAQLQPIVFAHLTQSHVSGPDDVLDVAQGQIGFPYYIANEGDGIALNVRHGVEIDGEDMEFEGGEFRVLRAGETAPPRDPVTYELLFRPVAIVRAEHELPPAWEVRPRRYWARFENVFGERFETRSPLDPRQSATFMPVDQAPRHPE